MSSALDALRCSAGHMIGHYVDWPDAGGPARLVWKIEADLIAFIRSSPGDFRLRLQAVPSVGGDALVLSTCIEDDHEMPFCIHKILAPDDRRAWSSLSRAGGAEALFCDPLDRPLWSTRCSLAASDGATSLLERGDLVFPKTAPDQINVVALAGATLWRADVPDIGVDFTESAGRRDLIVFSLVNGPLAMRADNLMGAAGRRLGAANDGRDLENDVADVLAKVFPADWVLAQPHKVKDGNELCDVLVVTPTDLLVVQSKKRAHRPVGGSFTSAHAASRIETLALEALRQVKGSFKDLTSGPVDLKVPDHRRTKLRLGALRTLQEVIPLPYRLLDGLLRIDPAGRRVHLLVVVNDVHSESWARLSTEVVGTMDRLATPLLLLSLGNLLELALCADGPDDFLAVFDAFALHVAARGELNDVRFLRKGARGDARTA